MTNEKLIGLIIVALACPLVLPLVIDDTDEKKDENER